MSMDADGYVYLAGSTQFPDFPTTAGAFQATFIGAIGGCPVPFGPILNCDDAFATKLATDGSGLVYSTFLGGSTTDDGTGVAVDATGRRIRTLREGSGIAGSHSVTWDGRDAAGSKVASGVYVYRLQWNGQSRMSRIILVR
jgi:hypothetical protein